MLLYLLQYFVIIIIVVVTSPDERWLLLSSHARRQANQNQPDRGRDPLMQTLHNVLGACSNVCGRLFGVLLVGLIRACLAIYCINLLLLSLLLPPALLQQGYRSTARWDTALLSVWPVYWHKQTATLWSTTADTDFCVSTTISDCPFEPSLLPLAKWTMTYQTVSPLINDITPSSSSFYAKHYCTRSTLTTTRGRDKK